MSCSYPVPYWEYAQWLCEGFYYACWSVIFIAHFDNLIIKVRLQVFIRKYPFSVPANGSVSSSLGKKAERKTVHILWLNTNKTFGWLSSYMGYFKIDQLKTHLALKYIVGLFFIHTNYFCYFITIFFLLVCELLKGTSQ